MRKLFEHEAADLVCPFLSGPAKKTHCVGSRCMMWLTDARIEVSEDHPVYGKTRIRGHCTQVGR